MVHFKNRILKMIAVVLIIVIVAVIFSIVVDPYSVFHYDSIRCHSGDPNSRFVKVKYIINNPDKFNSFIFGSSRVGYVHTDQINDDDNMWYNMTYSNAGVEDTLYSLNILVSNGVIPKNVMVGLDGVDGNDPFRFDGDLLRTQYPDSIRRKIAFYKSYLNPSISMEALITLDWKNRKETLIDREQFYEKGYDTVVGTPDFEYNKEKLVVKMPKLELDESVNESLEVIRELIELCDENDINLILFTNPIHYSFYINEVSRGYLLYIREIARMHDIYCFAGLNSICMDDSNYWEEVHFTKEIGDEIIGAIFNGASIEGYDMDILITKENANEYYDNSLKEYYNLLDLEE